MQLHISSSSQDRFLSHSVALNFLGDGLRDALTPNHQRTDHMGQLTIKNLEVSFHSREGTIHAVDGIDLCISRGGCWAGWRVRFRKSVTCNSILQLLPPPAQFGKGRLNGRGKTCFSKLMTG